MKTYLMNSRLLSVVTLATLPVLVGLLALSLAGCGPATQSAQAEGAQQVATGCGSCIFEMDGVEECVAAVKIDGKAYLVTGTEVDAHNIGLCSAEKTAEVTGAVEGDKFVAKSYKLVK